MSFEIEKNISLPDLGTNSKYPLADLEIGDSFVVTIGERAAVARACWARKHGSSNNWNYTSRKCDGGVRFWRTA